MTRWLLSLAVVMLAAAPASAQEPTPFRWDTHEAIPRRISDAALGAGVALDVWQAFRDPDHRHRWALLCRNLFTFTVVESGKRLIHRTRPDRSDRRSFPSGHAAWATAAASSPLTASLSLTVDWGRQAGGAHFGSDVVIGAGVGGLSRWVCRPR